MPHITTCIIWKGNSFKKEPFMRKRHKTKNRTRTMENFLPPKKSVKHEECLSIKTPKLKNEKYQALLNWIDEAKGIVRFIPLMAHKMNEIANNNLQKILSGNNLQKT